MRTALLLMTIVLFSLSTQAQGYKIKVKVKGMNPNDTLLMGHRFSDKIFADDTTLIDKSGYGVFKGSEMMDGGIYVILMPAKKNVYFEFLLDKDQQEFTLETDTTDFLKNMKVSGSDLNKRFYEFQNKWVGLQNQAMEIHNKSKNLKEGSDSLAILQKEFQKLDDDRIALLKKAYTDNPKSMLGLLARAMTPVDVPEIPLPEGTPEAKRDSLERLYKYVYNKDHYFDHFEFNDDRMLRTPLFEARLKEFITKIVLMDPDSLTKESFILCDKAKAQKDVFRFVTVYLTNHFETSNIMGMDRIFVNLVERYYTTGDAWWADSTLTSKIIKRANDLKPTLIGNIAPDLRMETMDKQIVTLHQTKADYTILVFFEPSCGHCKKAMPALFEWYNKVRGQKIEVFAVYTQVDEKEWKEFVDKYGFDWINVWDPYGFSNFRKYYDIVSTPVIMVLDKDKIIIAKKLGVEQIEQVIDHHRKFKK
jgi:thiol-disulfide isomerase/thioredoxin